MTDADTLEELCKNARILRYDLKSVVFPMEGVKIPAFVGKITIKMNGTKNMMNFAHMLMEYLLPQVGQKRLLQWKGTNLSFLQ